MPQHAYGIGFDSVRQGERRRLVAAQALFDPTTFRHLDTLGIREGMRCLEIGGGVESEFYTPSPCGKSAPPWSPPGA